MLDRLIPEYTTILAQVFSSCGRYYVAGTLEGQLAIWKVSQLVARGEDNRGKELGKWSMGCAVFSLACTHKFLIVGGKEVVKCWAWESLTEGEEIGDCDWSIEFKGRGEVNSIVILMDMGTEGKLVIGMGDSNSYIVDIETREIVRALSGHTGYIHTVSCGRGETASTVASGGEDGLVKLWDIRKAECAHTLIPKDKTELSRPKLGKYISAVALSQDWLACGGGPRLALWHLKSLAVAVPLPPEDKEVKTVSFHDETVMVGGRGRTLYQTNFSGEVTAEVSVSSGVVYTIAYLESPSILCATGSSSNIDICAPSFNYKDVTIRFPVS